MRSWLSVFILAIYSFRALGPAILFLLTTSSASAAGLLEKVRQRLQSSLALPIRVQPARHSEGQLWQIGAALRLLATRPAATAQPPPAEYPRLLVYDYVSRQLGAQLQA